MSSTTRNMTEGSVPGHLISFALPLFAGSILQQFYSIVDSWVVGNYIGDSALAAVGASFPVSFMMIALFLGLSTGGTVVISQYFGAGKADKVAAAIDTLYSVILLGAVPLTVLFLFLTKPLLGILNVSDSFYSEAYTYLIVISAGLIGTVGYNANAGILQGLGDSKTPLLFLAVATILNTVLDLVSVLVLHMGVLGVALSTIIAQLVSWIFGIFYINRKYPEFSIHPLRFRYDPAMFRAILRVGIPASLQQAMVTFGMMFCVAKVNSYGEAYTASYNVGNKIDNFIWLALQALSVAVTSFVGQNVGVGNYDRAKKGIRVVILLALGCCAFFMALGIPLRHELIAIFSKNPETIKAGGEYLWFILWGYPPLAVMTCLNNAMRGAGESLFPMITSFITMVLLRLPLIYLFTDLLGVHYMYLACSVSWAIGCVIVVAYYYSGRWKRHGSIAASEQ